MARPVPVLLLAQELVQGGSERQLAEAARMLDRERFAPHAGSLRPHGFRAEELRRAGVPVAVFPLSSFRSLDLVRAARKLKHYIREHGIELVHSFDTPCNVFGAPVARASRMPVVVTSQRSFRTLATPFFRRCLRLTDRLADAVVVNCAAIERHLREDEGVPASRIRVCHNGVDTGRFSPGEEPRPPALAGARLVIGVVSALRPEKALPALVTAFAQVRPLRPGMRLVIVGSGAALPELETLAGELGILSDCVFTPSAAEVTAWLRAIDIFVLPSRTEGLSNSLMEAMACGCCAVASAVGGNPELVEHERTGLLFPPGDTARLAAHLARLIEQEPLRRRLAAAGLERIRTRFTSQAMAVRLGAIYDELLERNARDALDRRKCSDKA